METISTSEEKFRIFHSPSLSSPKFPQPIFFPTRKFGPTISTLELADDDKPCRPETAECIALDPVVFPPRLSSLPFCSFSRSLFCMAPECTSSSGKLVNFSSWYALICYNFPGRSHVVTRDNKHCYHYVDFIFEK